ncbi:MAG: DnaA/Hda family protein [Defluviicoccus sp.]
MAGSRQLPLPFEPQPSLAAADFLVADCNREAVAWLERWPDWPAPSVVVFGPSGCGKSHLGRMFLARTGGVSVAQAELGHASPAAALSLLAAPGMAPGIVIDDADRAIEAGHEAPLLHLFNVAREESRALLLTAQTPPARWRIRLADLRSRLTSCPAVAIGPPDQALIAAILVKLFADRQLGVDEAVVGYLVNRIERSFAAARDIVARIDAASLSARRRVTVPLAAEALRCTLPEE